jgi:hypothetical protein
VRVMSASPTRSAGTKKMKFATSKGKRSLRRHSNCQRHNDLHSLLVLFKE